MTLPKIYNPYEGQVLPWSSLTKVELINSISYRPNEFISTIYPNSPINFSELYQYLLSRLSPEDLADPTKNSKICQQYFLERWFDFIHVDVDDDEVSD